LSRLLGIKLLIAHDRYKRGDSIAKKNRNKILVPEASQGLDQLKAKVIGTSKPKDVALEVANYLIQETTKDQTYYTYNMFGLFIYIYLKGVTHR